MSRLPTGFRPVLALAFGLLLAAPATAQTFAPSGRILSIGLGGGVTVPVSDAKDAFDSGFNGHGFVRLNLPLFPIQPRLDFTFQKLDVKDVQFAAPDFASGGTYTGGEQQVLSGLAQAQLALVRSGPVQPYVVAGVGLSSFKTTLEGDTGTASVDDTATKLTVNGGAGVNLKLGGLSGYVEGRIQNIMNDGELVDFKSVQLVPVSFGIVF